MKSNSFTILAGRFAILGGLFGFLYSFSFIVISRNHPELGGLLSGLFLMLGGFCSVIALTELFQQLHEGGASFALLAFVLSVGAAVGSLLHGGFDLANGIHPPVALNTDLPSPVDPRGLLTFGIAGISLFFFSWLMMKNNHFSRGLVYLGYFSALLLVVIYLARLVILNPASRIIGIPALLEGFLVNPIWYIWLGIAFFHER